MKNTLLLDVFNHKPVSRVPVWLMRQAGRILTQYKQTRSKATNFVEFVKSPNLAAEVTVQPVDILNIDAAIIFSDILVIAEAMGLPYQIIEEKGPIFQNKIRSEHDLNKLHIAQTEDYSYLLEAIKITKNNLNNRVPLIGFAAAPWTIMAYIVEGSGSKTFSQAKKILYQNSNLAYQILQKITDSTINYLNDQITAGVDVIQIFDSWAGVLNYDLYKNFSYPYIQQILKALNNKVPTIVFAKDAHFFVKDFNMFTSNAVGLDWTLTDKNIFNQVTNKIFQGNADPCLLYASEKTIKLEVNKMLQFFGYKNYIANLGHGLYPDLDVEKVKFFINEVKENSITYFKSNN